MPRMEQDKQHWTSLNNISRARLWWSYHGTARSGKRCTIGSQEFDGYSRKSIGDSGVSPKAEEIGKSAVMPSDETGANECHGNFGNASLYAAEEIEFLPAVSRFNT